MRPERHRALSLSKGTDVFDSLLPALGVWRRPRRGQGQALRVVRVACRDLSSGRRKETSAGA